MKSTDVRDLHWLEIRDRLTGHRETVWQWLLAHGPATTAVISAVTRIPLLTVRPRVSELCAWGFAECLGRVDHQGIYRAIPVAEAQARHAEAVRESQLQLKLQAVP